MLFFLSVPFDPLPYNEGCAHSSDIMPFRKIMPSASLRLVKGNNFSLERLRSKLLPSLPAFETV